MLLQEVNPLPEKAEAFVTALKTFGLQYSEVHQADACGIRLFGLRIVPGLNNGMAVLAKAPLTGCGKTRLLRNTSRSAHVPCRCQHSPQDAQKGNLLTRPTRGAPRRGLVPGKAAASEEANRTLRRTVSL
jgi:hypothetical protein